MGDGAADTGSTGATSTPIESTLPARREEDGRRPWLGAGEPAVTVVVAIAVSICAWRRSPVEALALAGATSVATRRWQVGAGVAVIGLLMVVRSIAVHDGLTPDELGRFTGWATVAADPDPRFNATRLLVQIEDERFELWVRGRAARLRVDTWQQGDRVWVVGTRRPLDAERAGRVAWQHVVGAFDHDVLGDRVPGRRLEVASNRVRALIARAM